MSGRMHVDAILVENRFRTDLGDLDQLAESIKAIGLLHPIVVSNTGRLVAGARRLEACRRLEMKYIPVTVPKSWEDASAALVAERDENTCRKQMTPSELAALGRALEDLYRPAAQQRQARPGDPRRGDNSASAVPGNRTSEKARVREQVGEALGVSGATYQRISRVAKDAENHHLSDEQREAARDALAAMDGGRGTKAAYQEYMSGNGRHEPESVVEMTERQASVAASQKRRVVQMISGLSGWADGVEAIDIAKVRAVMEPAEIGEWSRSLSEALKKLRRFQTHLQNGKAS